jgi:hypothetical protein
VLLHFACIQSRSAILVSSTSRDTALVFILRFYFRQHPFTHSQSHSPLNADTMLLSTITILAAIAIPAVMADNVGIQGSAKQNKPDHSLLRRDLANCKNNLDCDFPGTTDPLLPRTCALPLSNDPNYKSYDAVVRNGFGVCYSDGCGCYVGTARLSERLPPLISLLDRRF